MPLPERTRLFQAAGQVYCPDPIQRRRLLKTKRRLDKAARADNPAELQERHVMNCIECGSCSYVCPAKRYLVQNIRIGKTIVRAAATAGGKGGKS